MARSPGSRNACLHGPHWMSPCPHTATSHPHLTRTRLPACSRVNWNPGLVLFVREGVELPDAAPLPPLESQHHWPSEVEAAADDAGMSAGAIAGVAVGAAAAVLAAAGVAVVLWRWRRRGSAAGSSAASLLPPPTPTLPPGIELVGSLGFSSASVKARSSEDGDQQQLAEAGSVVQIASGVSHQPMSTPRRRGAGGSPSAAAGLAAAGGTPFAAASLALRRSASWGTGGAGAAVGAPESPVSLSASSSTAGSGSAALAAQLMAGWEEALVPESAVEPIRGSDGQPVVLGQGGYARRLGAGCCCRRRYFCITYSCPPGRTALAARGRPRPHSFGEVYKVQLRGSAVCAAKILDWGQGAGTAALQEMFVQEAVRCWGGVVWWAVGCGQLAGAGLALAAPRECDVFVHACSHLPAAIHASHLPLLPRCSACCAGCSTPTLCRCAALRWPCLPAWPASGSAGCTHAG